MNAPLYPWLVTPWGQLAARRHNLPHALLIHGRSGLGKTALARAFAQRVLCESSEDKEMACGVCDGCRWFEQGNHPDFRVLEPEALAQAPAEQSKPRESESASRQIKIDQVRETQDFLAIGTHRRKARVLLIRPAESMNAATGNALLKSLEEPPPGTLFLLVSSTPERLLPTVRSRCQEIPVASARLEQAEDWLREQGIKEPAIALAYSGNAPLAALEEEAGRAEREGVIARLAAGERAPIELADACQGVAPATVVGWLQRWAFDLALAKAAGIVRYHVRNAAALRALADALPQESLLRFARSLVGERAIAEHPLNPRLFFEGMFLRYAQLWEPRNE